MTIINHNEKVSQRFLDIMNSLKNAGLRALIDIPIDLKGTRSEGIIGSYSEFLRIAQGQGEDCLVYIFETCQNAGFDLKANGYATYVAHSLRDMWKQYPMHRNDTKEYNSKLLRPIMPLNFKASAIAAYPILSCGMACSMYLEDMIVRELGLSRTRKYKGGKIVKLTA